MILIGINYGMLFVPTTDYSILLGFFFVASSLWVLGTTHTKHTRNGKTKYPLTLALRRWNITFYNNNLCVSCIIRNENETTQKNSIRFNISDNFDAIRPIFGRFILLCLFLMISAKLLICLFCYRRKKTSRTIFAL